MPSPDAVLEWRRQDVWRPWIAGLDGTADVQLAGLLRARFAALRSFHAARPTDVASYRRLGIVPLRREQWQQLVEECFLSQIDDRSMADAVHDISRVQFDLLPPDRVHFCCDERLLEQRDGYHLIYGSLSLLAVAIQLDKRFGSDFKSALRRRGEPVVFVCDIPTTQIEDEVLTKLAVSLREAGARENVADDLAWPFDFHFSIPGALDAAAIVGHHRPRYVIDTVYGHDIREEAAEAEAPR